LTALNVFYDASVALTVMLRLDPTVILVPKSIIKVTTLVREDLSIDNMLVTAARWRPDLEAVRTLVAAAELTKVRRSGADWGHKLRNADFYETSAGEDIG